MKETKVEISSSLKNRIGKSFCFLEESGTSALTTSLSSLGIPEGSGVILPSFCCGHVVTGVKAAGMKPVFCDVNARDYNCHQKNIETAISDEIKAIVLVHLFGYPAYPDKIISLARRKSLFIIEDFCQALGGYYKGEPLGSFGDISFTSFGYEKIIDCGGGGAIFTNNEEFAARVESFQRRQESSEKSRDTWLTNLRRLLPSLDNNIQTRKLNSQLFEEMLNGSMLEKPDYDLSQGAIFRYSCLLKGHGREVRGKKKNLIEHMRGKGFRISGHYSPPLHTIHNNAGDLPTTEDVSSRIINFFVKPGVDYGEVGKTAAEVNSFLQRGA